jgi:hypothetical protein
LLEILLCLSIIGKADASGAGDFISLHQLLGEDLARFNLGGLLGRTEDLHPPDEKLVDDALRQGRLGTDNGEVDPVFLSCFSQPVYIGGLDFKVMGNLSRAGVARSDVNILYLRALG